MVFAILVYQIRRSNLLDDSMQAFETIRADQMRQRFR